MNKTSWHIEKIAPLPSVEAHVTPLRRYRLGFQPVPAIYFKNKFRGSKYKGRDPLTGCV